MKLYCILMGAICALVGSAFFNMGAFGLSILATLVAGCFGLAAVVQYDED